MNGSFLKELKTWMQMAPSPIRSWWEVFRRLTTHQNLRRLGWSDYLVSTYEGFAFGQNCLVLGGYTGDSTDRWLKCQPKSVQVFEPISKYYNVLITRFSNEPCVFIHKFAAGSQNRLISLGVGGDETGLRADGPKENCQERSLSEWMQSNDLSFGMTEINIEGGEYDLLESLSSDDMLRLGAIALQFHFTDEETVRRREEIKIKLKKTHVAILDLELVWALWVPRLSFPQSSIVEA
jgi:FkbM family methyltransferase